jgi:hypothetical protein
MREAHNRRIIASLCPAGYEPRYRRMNLNEDGSTAEDYEDQRATASLEATYHTDGSASCLSMNSVIKRGTELAVGWL